VLIWDTVGGNVGERAMVGKCDLKPGEFKMEDEAGEQCLDLLDETQR
jgi:hypothetical protein